VLAFLAHQIPGAAHELHARKADDHDDDRDDHQDLDQREAA